MKTNNSQPYLELLGLLYFCFLLNAVSEYNFCELVDGSLLIYKLSDCARFAARRHTIYEVDVDRINSVPQPAGSTKNTELLLRQKSGSDDTLSARRGFTFLTKSVSAPCICDAHGPETCKCNPEDSFGDALDVILGT